MKQEAKEKIYRSYVTGCLKVIACNTAKIGGGAVIKKSYDDIINKIDKVGAYSKNIQPKQNTDQIIATVVAKGGLRLIDNTRKEDKT